MHEYPVFANGLSWEKKKKKKKHRLKIWLILLYSRLCMQSVRAGRWARGVHECACCEYKPAYRMGIAIEDHSKKSDSLHAAISRNEQQNSIFSVQARFKADKTGIPIREKNVLRTIGWIKMNLLIPALCLGNCCKSFFQSSDHKQQQQHRTKRLRHNHSRTSQFSTTTLPDKESTEQPDQHYIFVAITN